MSEAQKQFFSFIREFSLRSTTISVRPEKYISVAYVPMYYPEMSFHILEKELHKAIPESTGKLTVAWERIMRDAQDMHIAKITVDSEIADHVRKALVNIELKIPHEIQVILYEELDDIAFDATMEHQRNGGDLKILQVSNFSPYAALKGIKIAKDIIGCEGNVPNELQNLNIVEYVVSLKSSGKRE